MNLEMACKIIAAKHLQIVDKPVDNLGKTCGQLSGYLENMSYSLERYVTNLYETSDISNDTHFDQFCQQFLLQNWENLVQNGWDQTCHIICDDTPKSGTLFAHEYDIYG